MIMMLLVVRLMMLFSVCHRTFVHAMGQRVAAASAVVVVVGAATSCGACLSQTYIRTQVLLLIVPARHRERHCERALSILLIVPACHREP